VVDEPTLEQVFRERWGYVLASLVGLVVLLYAYVTPWVIPG